MEKEWRELNEETGRLLARMSKQSLAFVAKSINNGWRPGEAIVFPGVVAPVENVGNLPAPESGAASAIDPPVVDAGASEEAPDLDVSTMNIERADNSEAMEVDSEGPDPRADVDRFFERCRSEEDDSAPVRLAPGCGCTPKVRRCARE